MIKRVKEVCLHPCCRRWLQILIFLLCVCVPVVALAADQCFLAREAQPDFLALLLSPPVGVEQLAVMAELKAAEKGARQ